MDESTLQLVNKLQEELNYHRKRYYIDDSPIISDQQFDALHDQFLTYQKEYPELIDQVGYRSETDSVVHVHPMLSLKSTKDMLTVSGIFAHMKGTISCEPKLDGLSAELLYRGSRLVTAATRGDGVIGEDITQNIRKLYNVPDTIDTTDAVEVYGEVFITKKDFMIINQERIRLGQSIYKSPRNAAAGIIRSKDNRKSLEYLSFFPYTLFGINAETQADCFNWLERNKFDILDELVDIVDSDIELYEYYQRMLHKRSELPFDIDGLVFKLCVIAERERILDSRTHPNWAIAFKFNADGVVTRINDVIFQVGKSGIIAPVACFDEVTVHKSKVTRAALANQSKITEKDIMIGDNVVVEMANDVIPYVASVVKEDRCGKELPIIFPTNCPSCSSILTKIGPHWCCTSQSCPAQLHGRITAAVGRNGFNIKGLGGTIINKLIKNGIVRDISDIFTLDKDAILLNTYSDCGIKNAWKICAEIKKARNVPLNKFIFALGIPDVSTATSEKLAEAYGCLNNLTTSIYEKGVVKLPNTDSMTLELIDAFISDYTNIEMIQRMLNSGVDVLCNEKRETGVVVKKYTVTGKLTMLRSDFEKIMELNGYKRNDQVSNNIEFLVCGIDPSSDKISSANRLGKPIYTEDQILQKLGISL